MKRHKLKKKWKILILFLVVGGIYIYKTKTTNGVVEEPKQEIAKTERITIEEQKKDEPIEEKIEVVEEQPKQIKETANLGFFPSVENFNITLKGTKHNAEGFKFYMDEDIDISITGDYPEGNIYIINHGNEIKETYTYGEAIKETIFNNSVFFINYEEGSLGYYDIVFVSNNTILGYATIELVE